MNAEHPRSGDGTLVVQQKYEAHSTPDQTELHAAFLVQRSVQPGRHWIRTILRVPGNANRIPAQAFDLVMTALGLHLRSGNRVPSCCNPPVQQRSYLNDANEWYRLRSPLRNGGLAVRGAISRLTCCFFQLIHSGQFIHIGSDETAVTALILVRGSVGR